MRSIPPPKESSASLRLDEEAIEIRLPAVGFRPAWWGLAFSLFAMTFSLTLTGVGAWLASNGAARDAASIAFFVIFLSFGALMTILTTHMFVWTLAASRRTAEIIATPKQVALTIRGLWRTTSRSWRRDQLRGFDADLHGLWVFGSGRPQRFLAERPLNELRWLAEALGAALDLPSREPRRESEIDVYVCFEGEDAPQTFSGMFGYNPASGPTKMESVQPARLAVEPGRMTLRLAANRLQAMRFFQPRRTWWGLPEWMKAIHLGISRLYPVEENAIAWQEIDGLTCLKIEAPYPADVSLRIWSDDAESLIDAVERFWPPEAE
ncbi:MAG TPA: hypothetical protein VMV10_03275 [Pirellulales bacterium]|nr:hypothetical protein [Pirellulales bacterium]